MTRKMHSTKRPAPAAASCRRNCADRIFAHDTGTVTTPPMSRHFTFTEGSRLVRVRCYLRYLHDDTYAAPGWYPPSERVLEFSQPFYWS
jgi:hypothetical protein